MLQPFSYVKATSVQHAAELASEPGASFLAGGTDLIIDLRERRREPSMLIDISELPELSSVRVETEVVRVGACVSVAAVGADPTVRAEFPALAQATDQFADFLTRNKATVGGNIVNASPGADLTVPLLALDASVVLTADGETRTLALDAFMLGPRETALRPGEIVCEILIPRGAPAGQRYEKLGLRQGGAIAIVSSAVLLDAVEGRCRRVRIALGAVAPRPFCSLAAEQLIEGTELSEQSINRAAELAADSAHPIDDVRATSEYRRAMVAALVARGIRAAWADAQPRQSEPSGG